MIESKVIEKFMEDNGLEPYDVFMAEGKLENYSPLYFNEDFLKINQTQKNYN